MRFKEFLEGLSDMKKQKDRSLGDGTEGIDERFDDVESQNGPTLDAVADILKANQLYVLTLYWRPLKRDVENSYTLVGNVMLKDRNSGDIDDVHRLLKQSFSDIELQFKHFGWIPQTSTKDHEDDKQKVEFFIHLSR